LVFWIVDQWKSGFLFKKRMAYGNWGAFVYKNGERQKNREDNTPYYEDELEPGYYQAFGGNDESGLRQSTKKDFHCVHASLGDGDFRLCGYKSWPEIYYKKNNVDIADYRIEKETPKEKWDWYDSDGIEGEMGGYKFKAWPSDGPEAVNLELIEPAGTQWTGKSGMYMGAGYED
jgi:hypothetical protein